MNAQTFWQKWMVGSAWSHRQDFKRFVRLMNKHPEYLDYMFLFVLELSDEIYRETFVKLHMTARGYDPTHLARPRRGWSEER